MARKKASQEIAFGLHGINCSFEKWMIIGRRSISIPSKDSCRNFKDIDRRSQAPIALHSAMILEWNSMVDHAGT